MTTQTYSVKTSRVILILLFLLALLACGNLFAQSNAHPHLFFNRTGMDGLRHTALNDPRLNKIWLQFKEERVDSSFLIVVKPGNVKEIDEGRDYGDALADMSIAYVVTRDRKYVNKSFEIMQGLAAKSNWGSSLIKAHISMGFALAWDVMYHELSASQKNVILRAIRTHADNSVDNDVYSNVNWTPSAGEGLVGLAFKGDGDAEFNHFVDDLVKDAKKNFKEKSRSVLWAHGTDGFPHQGLGYWRKYAHVGAFFHALRFNEPQNDWYRLGSEYPGSEFLKNMAYPRIYADVKHRDLSTLTWADSRQVRVKPGGHYGNLGTLMLVASEYKDGYVMDFIDHLLENVDIKYNGEDWTTFLFYNDSGIPAQSYQDLPLSKYWPDMEAAIFRSGWQKEDLVFFMRSGSPGGHSRQLKSLSPGGHDHPDANGFVLFYNNDYLAAEDATYPLIGPDAGNRKITYGHNTFLIDGLGQRGDKTKRIATTKASMDYLDADYLGYLRGDATDAYADIDAFYRNVIYKKHKYFIIVDELRDNAKHKYEFLLGTDSRHTITSAGENTFSVDPIDGQAKLPVVFVEPQSIDYEIDRARPYGIDISLVDLLKVRPKQNQNNAVFFSLHYPVKAGDAQPQYRKIYDGSRSGIVVDDDEYYLYNKAEAMYRFQNIATDAKLCYFKEDGKEFEYLMTGGKNFLYNAEIGLNATKPVVATFKGLHGQIRLKKGLAEAGIRLYYPGISGVSVDGQPGLVVNNGPGWIEFKLSPKTYEIGPSNARQTVTDNYEIMIDVSPVVDVPSQIVLAPERHHFGDVAVASISQHAFTVSNQGGSAEQLFLSLKGTDSAQFALMNVPPSFILQPNQSRQVDVQFTPKSAGEKNALLQIASIGTANKTTAVLIGNGVGLSEPSVSLSPRNYDFDVLEINQIAGKNFEVSNTGSSDLWINSIAITGRDANEFVLYGSSSPFVLQPGQIHHIRVTALSAAAGAKKALLELASNDPDTPVVQAGLTAEVAGDPVGLKSSSVVFEETQTGGSYLNRVRTSEELTGGSNQLYLATVTSKPYKKVTGIDGAGLKWTLVKSQCSGRSRTGMTVWMAKGESIDGFVTARFESKPNSAAIAVSRYSGADMVWPLTSVVSGNTTGEGGDCSNGEDSRSYTFNVGTTAADGRLFTAVAKRHKAHTFGEKHVQRKDFAFGTDKDISGLALADRVIDGTGAMTVEGSFDARNDWAVVAVEIQAKRLEQHPAIAVNPDAVNFGEVMLEEGEIIQIVSVSNAGDAELTIGDVSVSGRHAEQFLVHSDASGLTLSPGENLLLEVIFSPKSLGEKTAELQIESNDTNQPNLRIAMKSVVLTALIPDIELVSTVESFGDVLVNSSVLQALQIKNNGRVTLEISAMSITGNDSEAFRIKDKDQQFSVAPGQTETITVSFNPGSRGEKKATLVIFSNDPDEDELQVPLQGRGIRQATISVTPAAHNYGEVELNTSAIRNFIIQNRGDLALRLSSITIKGASKNEFGLASGADSEISLQAGETHHISVRFKPTSSGKHNAEVRIESNDPDNGSLDIALTGKGNEDVASITHVKIDQPLAGALFSVNDDIHYSGTAVDSVNGPLPVTDCVWKLEFAGDVFLLSDGVASGITSASVAGEYKLILEVVDDTGLLGADTTTIKVTEVNQKPVAVNDTVEANMNEYLKVDVLVNDIDPEGELDKASVTLVHRPRHGHASLYSGTGVIQYIPENSYVGLDSLTYFVRDAQGLTSRLATVFVKVLGPNPYLEIQSFAPNDRQVAFRKGESIRFSVDVSSNRALSFDWTLTNLKNQQSIKTSNRPVFSLNTDSIKGDESIVRVEVSDGRQTASQEWSLSQISHLELSSFSASYKKDQTVEITWEAEPQYENAGFNLLRGLSQGGPFEQINRELILADANKRQSFADTDVSAGTEYYYVLEGVHSDGDKETFGPVNVDLVIPDAYALNQNYPNPFNPETNISFQLPQRTRVIVRVFDVLGKEVRTLVDATRDAGIYSVKWDAKNNANRKVSSGIYYYSLTAGDFHKTRRMTLLK